MLMRFTFASNKLDQIPAFVPVTDAHFSPDGRWIAYETTANRNQEIRIDDLVAGTAQFITDPSSTNFDPAWRP